MMGAWTRRTARVRRLRADRSPSQPPKLLFINQYYWPDRASTAQHLTDLAESLANRGFECHVLCGKGGYQGDRASVPSNEIHNGVHIHRVGTTSLGRRSTIRRLTDYLVFYMRALFCALRLPRYDASITLTTPPIIGLIGVLLARLKGTRHIFWSMDLHPDAGIALGLMSRRNPITALLAWISDSVYRAADRVVVLGAYMADRIASKKVRANRIETIPVWSRRDEIYPIASEANPLRKSLGLTDKFVVMYSGNMGLAHAFDEIMLAAHHFRDRHDIVFLFVGDGPRKKEILAAKQSESLDNIVLRDYFPREELHASLSVADIHLISMRREMTGIVVPCKLYGAMASGRPCVFVGPEHCETADTIRESGCGMSVRLGEPETLIEAIAALAANPERCAIMGERGRATFLAEFEREECCASWAWMLGKLVGDPGVISVPPSPVVSTRKKRDMVVPSPLRRV